MSVSRTAGAAIFSRSAKIFYLLTLRFTFLKIFNFSKNFYHAAWKYRNNLRTNFKIVNLFRVLQFESDSISIWRVSLNFNCKDLRGDR